MRQHIPLNKQEKLFASSEPVLTFGARDEGRLQHQLDIATLQTLKLLKKQQAKLQKELKIASDHVDVRLKKIFRGGDSDLLDEVQSQGAPAFTLGGRGEETTGARRPPPRRGKATTTATPSSCASPPTSSPLPLKASPGRSPCPPRAVFPVPFAESPFSSPVRWAEVAFAEASVAARGPGAGAGAEGPGRGPTPPPLLARVACYVLDEVLKRDSNVGGVWGLLRRTILDSIYSPLAEAEGPAAAAPDAGAREGAPAYPPRETTYETVLDFSNYRLWMQEIEALRRTNDIPWRRIHFLNSLLTKSIHVLQFVGRRADNSWLRKVFLAWNRYTQRARVFHNASLRLITNNRRRRVEGQCFLRWRRSTLQGKVEKLYGALSDHKREAHMNDQAHLNTILQLRNQLSAVTDVKKLMEAEMEDELLGLRESHRFAENALREAYKRSVKYAERYKTHARRWERLAKTFRPTESCPCVPKSLFSLSITLTRIECEFSKPYRIGSFRIDFARKTLSKFLLCWVNKVMRASPRGKVWVPKDRIACSSHAHSDGAELGDVVVKSKLMNDTALLYLVRELRRLQNAENEPSREEFSDYAKTFPSPNLLGITENSDIMNTALEEAYQVLYVYTSEGLYPCLLMHCPRFFFKRRSKDASLQNSARNFQHDDLVYNLSMLWLLAALFTGYVRFHYGMEAFFASKWPQYLHCENEDALRRSTQQSLGVPSVSSLTEPPNGSATCSSRAPTKDDNGARASGISDSDGGGGFSKKLSETSSAPGFSLTTHSLTRDTRALKMNSFLLPQGQTSSYAFRGNDVVDTNSDIEVYTGRKDADLPSSDWEKDVDGILNDIVRSEEREMRKRRRLRRKEEIHEESMQRSTNITVPYMGVESGDVGGSRILELNPIQEKPPSNERYKVTPNGIHKEETNLCGTFSDTALAVSSDSSHRLRNGTSDRLASETSSTSEEELTDTNSEEEIAALSRDGNPSGSTRLFGEPHDSVDAVRQLFFNKVPQPSSVFSVCFGKNDKKKDRNGVVRLLQLPGERTEARRLERARNGGLHAFVERTLVDRERRQQWFGMARVVVSLITRLHLLDVNLRTKTAKASSAERSTALYDRSESSTKTQSKHDSEACISVSHRTKVSSDTHSTVSATPTSRIRADGTTKTVRKTSHLNPRHQENRNPPITRDSGPSQEAPERIRSTNRLAPEVCASQKQNNTEEPSEETAALRSVSFHDSSGIREGHARSTMVAGGGSLKTTSFVDFVGALPPVSTNQGVQPSSRAFESGVAPTTVPERLSDVDRSMAARTSTHLSSYELPQGPLDPLIIRPEVPYKGPRCKVLYRFDLQKNEK